MSWHGSLTCSYCYNRGHSRRKCPTMKERHDKYVQAIADGTESELGWTYRSAHREWQDQQNTLKESNKVCAYCHEHGHRVNTCPDRLAVVDALRKADEWWKPFIANVFEKYGLGVGTVFQTEAYVNDAYQLNVPHIVTGIRQDKRGSMSIIQLLARDQWVLQATNMVTMKASNVRVGEDFRIFLFRELFAVLGDGLEDYDFSVSYYSNNNEKHRGKEVVSIFCGSIPRRYDEDADQWLVSTHSEPFESHENWWYDLETKREINKLFRDDKCKTRLVDEDYANSVVRFVKLLQERGEI